METINEIIKTSSESLRGHMKFEEYQQYLIATIFYRYLSYKIEKESNKKLFKFNINFEEAFNEENYDFYGKKIRNESLQEYGYFIKVENLYKNIIKNKDLICKLDKAFNEVEFEDKSLNDLFDVDIPSLKSNKETCDIFKEVIVNINSLTFKDYNDEYNDLMKFFMKKSFTPSEISLLLSKLVYSNGKTLKNVYDAACGSCSTLLKLSENNEVINYYGQELNNNNYNLARMNMIMHDIIPSNFHIYNEDSTTSKRKLPLMDVIISHPPFLKKWDADIGLLEEKRFNSYKKLPPKSKADYAFIETMIYQLKDDGLMAVAMPQGVLFRSNAEKEIRKNFILNNYIDSIIALPEKTFYKNIPTCIIVFRKNRTKNEKILFIDASKEYEKGDTLNYLSDASILKVVETYNNKIELDKYSSLCSIDEIKVNDYNLNIKLYVNTYEQKDKVDISEAINQISNLENKINLLNLKQKSLIDEITKNK